MRLSRFRLNERRDLALLREAASLFDTPHVLPLLRTLGEATEAPTLAHTLPALRAPSR